MQRVDPRCVSHHSALRVSCFAFQTSSITPPFASTQPISSAIHATASMSSFWQSRIHPPKRLEHEFTRQLMGHNSPLTIPRHIHTFFIDVIKCSPVANTLNPYTFTKFALYQPHVLIFDPKITKLSHLTPSEGSRWSRLVPLTATNPSAHFGHLDFHILVFVGRKFQFASVITSIECVDFTNARRVNYKSTVPMTSSRARQLLPPFHDPTFAWKQLPASFS